MAISKTILFIDDNPDLQAVVKTYLERHGLSVCLASDGISGIRFIEKQVPDLLLIDVGMPEMDGIQTVEKLHSQNLLGDLPVIFLTGNNEIQTVTRAAQLGVRDYVTKPFAMKELLQRIHDQIGGVSFLQLSKLISQLETPKEAPSELNAMIDGENWISYHSRWREQRVVVFQSKTTTFEKMKNLSEEESKKLIRVYARRRTLWRRVWPVE